MTMIPLSWLLGALILGREATAPLLVVGSCIGDRWWTVVGAQQKPPDIVHKETRETGGRTCGRSGPVPYLLGRAKVILFLPVCYFNFSVALFCDSVVESTYFIKLAEKTTKFEFNATHFAFCHSI